MSKYKETKHRRGKKAAVGLLFMILLWVAFFLILFVLQYVHLNKVLGYKGEVDIFIERNDKGTETYTILSGEKDYIKNMVALGSSSAANMPRDFDKQLKKSLDSMAKSKGDSTYYLNVWSGSVLLKSFGTKTTDKGTTKSAITADIIDRFFSSRQSPLEGQGQCIMEQSQRTGVPALVIISVAALESDWGKSGLSNDYCPRAQPYNNPADKYSNNLFGYKGSGTTGNCRWRTQECLSAQPPDNLGECATPCDTGKKCYYIIDNFRSYNNKCESIADFVDLISKGANYRNAMKYAQNPETMISEMGKAGYATDPNWANKVTGTMKTFLTQYPYVIIPAEGVYAEIPLPNGGRGRIEMVT